MSLATRIMKRADKAYVSLALPMFVVIVVMQVPTPQINMSSQQATSFFVALCLLRFLEWDFFFFYFHYAASSRRGRGSAVALCCVRRHLASFCCFVKQGVEEKMTVTFVFVISWRYFVVMKPRKEAFSHLLCLSSVVQIMFRGTSK